MGKKPVTELRKLKIDMVSLVDNPANQGAHVVLFKRAPEAADDVDKAPMKTEGGVQFPAAAFAYVPDQDTPSTWKLRLWETPQAKETMRQVGMAMAALGPGFRGNKVEIPEKDLAGVKAKVRAAWRKTHGDGEEMPAVLKSESEEKDERKEGDNMDEAQISKLIADAVQAANKPLLDEIAALKSANAEVAKRELVTKAEADERVRKLEHERDVDRETHRIEKSYPNLSDDPRKWAEMLLKFQPDSEDRKAIEKMLDTNNAAIPGLLGERGVSVRKAETTGAYEKILKAAGEIQGAEKCSHADAMTRAVERNPELWAVYQQEER